MKKFIIIGSIIGIVTSTIGALLVLMNDGNESFLPLLAIYPLYLGVVISNIFPILISALSVGVLAIFNLPSDTSASVAISIVNLLAWIILFTIIGYIASKSNALSSGYENQNLEAANQDRYNKFAVWGFILHPISTIIMAIVMYAIIYLTTNLEKTVMTGTVGLGLGFIAWALIIISGLFAIKGHRQIKLSHEKGQGLIYTTFVFITISILSIFI